ncbi:ATP-binding protein [Dongia sp.]|uniref:sensor histidine kinase n=1 Tax=Dongia sp. TaxID=1977262 RepID=UPI003750FD19
MNAPLAWLTWTYVLGVATAIPYMIDLSTSQRWLWWDGVIISAAATSGLQWLGIARSNRDQVRTAAAWISAGIAAWWLSALAGFACNMTGGDWALFPSPASVGFILFVPLLGVGLVLYIQRAVRQWFSIPLLCDLGVIAATLLVVVGLPVNAAIPYGSVETPIRVAVVVYPVVGALCMAFGLFSLLAYGWGARRWILVLLLLGVGCVVGADFFFSLARVDPALESAALLYPLWGIGFAFLSLAAFEHHRIVERQAPPMESLLLRVRQARQVLPASALIAIAATVIANIGHLDIGEAVSLLLPALLLLAGSSSTRGAWNRRQMRALQARNEATEDALRHSEARFGAVLEFSPDPMLVIDGLRRICVAGKGVESVFGHSRSELIGQSIDLLSPEMCGALPIESIKQLTAIQDAGTLASHRFNAMGRRKDGAALPIEGLVFPLNGGTERLFAVVLRDITERRTVEQELRAARDRAELADRAKSEFLANMSHELRTPLNAIIGFAEIIETQVFGSGDGRYPTYAKDIRQSGQHLLRLVKDILDFSRIETKNVMLRESEIVIADAVNDCLGMMHLRARESGVTMLADLPAALPHLIADEVKLKQVLLNLLGNAVKFTPRGGRITIGARHQPGEALILSVSDTGIGMREEDIPLALSPFGQVASAFAREHDGLGLGLPLARHLTELHQGSLEIVSRLGQGTTVHVRLPGKRLVEAVRQPPQLVQARA